MTDQEKCFLCGNIHLEHIHIFKLYEKISQFLAEVELKEEYAFVPEIKGKKQFPETEQAHFQALTSVEFSQSPIWLAWQYGFRTFDWKKAVPVPELIIKDVAALCALV